ncbi:MAG: EamA family transporter, partial [Candidatus Omnitrophica bacterium]|nr:EamA family transporter [Candidatus Omnitrophota bacterium]
FIVWIIYTFSLPLLIVSLLRNPLPELSPALWKTIAIMMPLEIGALLLYLRALKISPLSLAFPFLGLTPVFTILTSFILLEERLSAWGIIGVAIVSLGAYLLNARSAREGVFGPVRNIYREKGAILMIIVAFIYSLTSVLGKKAILASSAESFPAIYYTIFFVIITPVVCVKICLDYRHTGRKKPFLLLGAEQRKKIMLFIALGLSFAVSILFHYKALSLTRVSYMISVKRLSLVISVIYGALIFKEDAIGYRLLGALVMLGGVLILSFMQ